ncbi:MAG: 30S ribosomal protein S13 [Candidatus Ryanbacteria bacterium RIFCSPLOWO2_01_FULL_48_26]|uniref:Small ribosomal subunit protein uS13 n=1 Tax=Candidatus Ryanbacteria bacterium RIFCSPLOWO2_01_FULL_48_26 TaxID=1802126 RepID=A0A1G2GV29_9BACT|nr:MAG: 30S ribosomal protein S13 [Candidatus Ryanbacteria bacterium RIFCSPLOWO2_01_FULL_48_26]
MRILGVNIPDNKRIEVSLTYIYGIGRSASRKVLTDAKIDLNKKTGTLTSDEVVKIQSTAEKTYPMEGTLRQFIRSNIQRLKDIKSYRGTRHLRRLPARGQRTKTNSRTVRGNIRKTAGSGKRKVDLK